MERLPALLWTTISASVLWMLWFFLVRDLKIEIFRQRIFRIRDELFDYASDGHIRFDHPAYGELRTSMNSIIRFAHKISFSRAFFFTVARQFWPTTISKERLRALKDLPDGPVKNKLSAFHGRVLFEVFKVLMPGAFLLTPLISAVVRASFLYSSLKNRRDELAEAIEVQAIECDELSGRVLQLRTV